MQTPDKKLFHDMQEHSEKFSDQELEAMMDNLDQMPDVDEAWQQFAQQHIHSESPTHTWRKIAAMIIGILMVSGIAIAAVHIIRQSYQQQSSPVEKTAIANNTAKADPVDTRGNGNTIAGSVTFDNILFDKVLAEIAGYYHAVVVFQNEKARQIRLFYEWDQRNSIEEVAEQLNNFEQVSISIKGDSIIIK